MLHVADCLILGLPAMVGCKTFDLSVHDDQDAEPDVLSKVEEAGPQGAEAAEAGPGEAAEGAPGEAAPDEDAECASCTQDTLRCSETGVPQRCDVSVTGCAGWHDLVDQDGSVASCNGNAMCCGGACVVPSESDCYACGRQCTGSTPVCDHVLRRCGCSPEACGASNQLCDSASGECVAAPGPTLWVGFETSDDAGMAEGHFKTITLALEAVNTASDAAAGQAITHIVVAPGTYDVEHGETIPIVVRGGVSLEGQGPGKSIIRGTASNNVVQPSLTRGVFTSVVIGDFAKTNRISGFSFEAVSPGIFEHDQVTAIVCDRGNATPGAAPNTILNDLLFSADYGTGVFASTGTSLGGCNLSIVHSDIRSSGVGISAGGCSDSFPSAVSTVELEIGDGTSAGGNTFRYQRPADGVAVSIGPCVTKFAARNNTFFGMNTGILVAQPLRGSSSANHLVVEDNKLDQLTRAGLSLTGGLAVVDSLRRNVFSHISSNAVGGLKGVGTLLLGRDEDGFARIVTARENSYLNNDIGVLIASIYAYKQTFQPSDFGTQTDSGNNVFRCNVGPDTGGDVMVDLVPPVPMTFLFAGNQWDHTFSFMTRANLNNNPRPGSDLSARDETYVQFDVSNATQATALCERTP
jgi:hypothetical protein